MKTFANLINPTIVDDPIQRKYWEYTREALQEISRATATAIGLGNAPGAAATGDSSFDARNYLFLPGRAGGQTGYGGLSAADGLTFYGSKDPTGGKTSIIGGNVDSGTATLPVFEARHTSQSGRMNLCFDGTGPHLRVIGSGSIAFFELWRSSSLASGGINIWSGNTANPSGSGTIGCPQIGMLGSAANPPFISGNPTVELGHVSGGLWSATLTVGWNGRATARVNPQGHTVSTGVPLTVSGSAGQTGDLQDWTNSTPVVLSFIAADGTFNGPVVPTLLTVKDNVFSIVDDADTTKKAQFQCSGITTGTTRTYTFPNASTTLAGLAVANAFTLNQSITGSTNSIQLDILGNSTQTQNLLRLRSTPAGPVVRFSIANGGTTTINAGASVIPPIAAATLQVTSTIVSDVGAVVSITHEASNMNAIGMVGLQIDAHTIAMIDSTYTGLSVAVDAEGDASSTSSSVTALGFGMTLAATPPAEAQAVAGSIIWQASAAAPAGSHYFGLAPILSVQSSTGKIEQYSGLRCTYVVSSNTGILNHVTVEAPVVSAGTIDLVRGFYTKDLSAIAGVTTAWVIYSEGGNSAHAGNIFFGGTTMPTARVHLAAQTTAASTAPVKNTAGTLMTAAEAGAHEYDGSYHYLTNGTPTRGAICTAANVVVDGDGNVVTADGEILLAA